MTRRMLLAAFAASLLAAAPAARAATPKDTVVFASQIDDVITLDPGEAYEIRRRSSSPTSMTVSCATKPRT